MKRSFSHSRKNVNFYDQQNEWDNQQNVCKWKTTNVAIVIFLETFSLISQSAISRKEKRQKITATRILGGNANTLTFDPDSLRHFRTEVTSHELTPFRKCFCRIFLLFLLLNATIQSHATY